MILQQWIGHLYRSTIAMVIGCTAVLILVITVAMAHLQQQQFIQSTKAYHYEPFSKVTTNITSTSCIDNQPCVTTICVDNNPCHTFKSNSNSIMNDNNGNNINPPPSPDGSELASQQKV